MANDRRILIIAGSDSSGGAGLEADQKVIAAHGCYAMTATTALTVQNTQGVFDVHQTPPDFVRKQIAACIEDVGVDVVKTGMLASAEIVKVVADSLRKYGKPQCVIDPVIVSTSGHQLLPQKALERLCKELLPLATVLTPNLPEARLLLGRQNDQEMCSIDDMVALAKDLHAIGPKYVLVKGGHTLARKEPMVEPGTVTDILYDGNEIIRIQKPFVRSKNTHGTGCSLASAIASKMALGQPIVEAVKDASRYIEAGIMLSVNRGRGNGPINHFHSSYMLPFAPGYFLEYLLLRVDVAAAWKTHTEHEFVKQLARGALEMHAFRDYLIQDYLFLIQFARVKALAASKGRTMKQVSAGAKSVLRVEQETTHHVDFCRSFGIGESELQVAKPSTACLAYTGYLLDVLQSEDWYAGLIACAPCVIGYGVVAQRIFGDPCTARGEKNPYWKWIETYVAEDYVKAVEKEKRKLEEGAILQSPYRIEELAKIFISAAKLETEFWNVLPEKELSHDNVP